MRFHVSVAAAVVAACLLTVPAGAAPASAVKDFGVATRFDGDAPVIKVQSMLGPAPQSGSGGQRAPQPGVQRQGGGNRGGGGQQFNRGGGRQYGGGYRGGGYRGGHYHDRGDDGAGVAAGVLGGLLLGAIIANESQRSACSRRPGYDPRSRTYVGPDRRRYRCP